MKTIAKRFARNFRLKGERGAALVELALVTPMLLLLMIGIVEVGRYADYAIKVTNAARAGVAYGAQSLIMASDTGGIQAAASADSNSISGLTSTSQTFCTCADGAADAGCIVASCSANHRIVYVQVNTVGTLASLFNYPGLAALNSLTVHGLAIMRVAE